MSNPTIIYLEAEPIGSIIHGLRSTLDELLAKANSDEISEFASDDIRDLDAIACRAQMIASAIEARDAPKMKRYRR